MKFIFLTKDYFNRHPSSEFPEMLRKSDRPYVQLTIPCNHQLWAVPLRSYINPVDEKYLYTKGKYKGDIYDKLVAAMDDSNAVYQWRRKYVRKNMSGVVPTLTANQGEGGHNVCLVKTKQGIRKMTPKECFNTQGFPESFVLPDIADGRLYKQAGNSVCVSVVQRIAGQMLVAMK